jgi:hypothetical protein
MVLSPEDSAYYPDMMKRWGATCNGCHYSPDVVEGAVSESQSAGGTFPCTRQRYNVPRLRFSATLGGEPEIKVAMV